MNRDKLKREITEQFQLSLDQAMDCVEQAPDGRWIAASEWKIREIFQGLMADSFQKILQAKLDATDQVAFSPVARQMASKGLRGVSVLSAGGEVRLRRQYRWKKGVGGVCPADEALGISQSDVSVGARELCTLMGIASDFDQARGDLKRVGGLSLSKEKLRQITEGEGKNVRKVRDSGQLPAAWSAQQAKLPNGQTRVNVGVDGVMTPAVTQGEKDKRRQQHVTARQQRGKAAVGNLKPLPPARPGSDEKYKEKKIGVFYSQDKTLRHAFATEATCEAFGPLLNSYAMQGRITAPTENGHTRKK